MLNALLIAGIILLYTLQSFFCKCYSDRYPGKEEDSSLVFTIVSSFTVVVVTFLAAGCSFDFNVKTLLFGIFNALALFGYNFALIKASQTGSYAVLMVFSIAGAITVPAVVSVAAFGDHLSIWKVLSILVVLVSVYLISHRKGEKLSTGRVFFPACFLLFLCNGAYGSFLDAQQRVTGVAQKDEMVIITFGAAFLISALLLLIRKRKNFFPAMRQSKGSFLYLAICSLIAAFAINGLVLVLSLLDDVTMLYTLENASVLLLSVLGSYLFFHERLSKLNLAGCLIMCVALVGVSVF